MFLELSVECAIYSKSRFQPGLWGTFGNLLLFDPTSFLSGCSWFGAYSVHHCCVQVFYGFVDYVKVKKAFLALIYNGVRAAPLWNAADQKYIGRINGRISIALSPVLLTHACLLRGTRRVTIDLSSVIILSHGCLPPGGLCFSFFFHNISDSSVLSLIWKMKAPAHGHWTRRCNWCSWHHAQDPLMCLMFWEPMGAEMQNPQKLLSSVARAMAICSHAHHLVGWQGINISSLRCRRLQGKL